MAKPLILLLTCAVATVFYHSGRSAERRALTESAVADELVRLKHEIGRAYVSRDVAALERLYADDYTVTDEQGLVTGKAEEIADLRAGEAIYESTTYDDVRVRVYGDDAAIVAGRGTVKGKSPGGEFHTQYHSTNVFVKQGGRWRAVAAHISGVKKL